MKFFNIKLTAWLGSALILFGLSSCFPDSEDLSLGNLAVADFTITDISTDEARNTYLLTCTSDGGFMYEWDHGNGIVNTGSATDTAYYPDKGTYTVTLTVLSEGGHSTAQQQIVVEEDANLGENYVQGGDMEDESAWNFMSVGVTMTSYEFVDGVLKFTNPDPAQTNIGMWQALELEGGRSYQFSATVSGNGTSNSWMEVLILDEEPVEGTDYTNSPITGFNTWAGCGIAPFNGNLSTLSCLGDGTVVIPSDGTYYLYIKTGSWDGTLGDGVTIDNIKLIGGDVLSEGDNIVRGSNMEDETLWTVTNLGLEATNVEFTDGTLKFSNGTESAQTNIGVWQAVEVEAGRIYRFSATVNDPGSSGSWTEFYLGATEPSDGNDYTEGRVYSGDTVSFEESGTLYLLIKAGSWDGNLGAEGVTVDDVRLVELIN